MGSETRSTLIKKDGVTRGTFQGLKERGFNTLVSVQPQKVHRGRFGGTCTFYSNEPKQ